MSGFFLPKPLFANGFIHLLTKASSTVMQQSRLRKSLILRFPNACRFWHRAQKRQREQFCFQALLRTENGAAICNMCFCLHGELCKEWWLNVDLKELLPQSIVAWVWSEYCNCFFNMRFSSSSCALRFCNSLFRCPLFWHASRSLWDNGKREKSQCSKNACFGNAV